MNARLITKAEFLETKGWTVKRNHGFDRRVGSWDTYTIS